MYSKDSTGFSELLNQWVNFKSFASLYKDCGGSMGVRMFSEHRCEAAAPTEPAGETQRPPVADRSRPKEVPLGYGEIP